MRLSRHRLVLPMLAGIALLAGCTATAAGTIAPGTSASPGATASTQPAGTASTQPSGTASTQPAAAAGNTLTIDGKSVVIGGKGKVTQTTFADIVANLRFGGIPNGQPENAGPGDYAGMVQLGGTIKGDLTVANMVDLTITVDLVADGFLAGVNTWKSAFNKSVFNNAGGPTLEVAGKDGLFTTVKVKGAKLTPDKGQPANKATADIMVDISFTTITKE